MNWGDLRVFLTVVESGGISRAARRLRQSHATVWRRVRALEVTVGIELFDRSAQGFVPSEAGSVLYQELSGLSRVIDGGAQAVWDGEGALRGEVRVGVPIDQLAELVAERLPDLNERHPELTVELLHVQPAPKNYEACDIVVAPQAADLDGFVRVADYALRYGLYSSPEYIAPHRSQSGEFDLRDLDFIDFDRSTREALQSYAHPVSSLLSTLDGINVSLKCSHPYLRQIAARAGMGVLLAVEIGARCDEGLIQIADWTTVGETPLSLHVNSSRLQEQRVGAVRDLMLEVMAPLPRWRGGEAAGNARSEGSPGKAS